MHETSSPAPVTEECYTEKPIMQLHSGSTTEDNPDIEVMALSPKSLMSTNRFTCEICKKKFLRNQNLQLHKRGHKVFFKHENKSPSCNNSKKQGRMRKKVYVCPEPTCLHHNRSHAIGDLAGMKKHYHRKHGEKKWDCRRCSRSYAVQSDLKAHSKICGSRDFRCDCGSIFSRHESFLAHWANCDAFRPETSENPTPGFTATPVTGNRRLFKTISSLSLKNLSHITPAEHSNPNNEQEQGSNNGGTESEKLITSSESLAHQEFLVNDPLTTNNFSDIINFFSDNNEFADPSRIRCGFSYSVSQYSAPFFSENNLNNMDSVNSTSGSEIIIQNFVPGENSGSNRGFSASSSSSTARTGINNSEEQTEEDDKFLGDLSGTLINEGHEQINFFDPIPFEDNSEEGFLPQDLGDGRDKLTFKFLAVGETERERDVF